MTADIGTAHGTRRGLRLVELLAPLSLVTDLGMGAPDEAAMRTCLVATQLARRMNLPEAVVADVYYTTLLKHIGCTATAMVEAEHLGGDELAMRPLFGQTDDRRPRDMLNLLRRAGSGAPVGRRVRIAAGTLAGVRWGPEVQRGVCEVGGMMASRLRMPNAVRTALEHGFERWDGKGAPAKLAGEQIALPARFAQVAARAMSTCDGGSPAAATAAVRASSGGWLDPEISSCFVAHGEAIMAEIASTDVMGAVVDAEPQPWRTVGGSELNDVLRAFADMVDLKSPSTAGHSPRVADLAGRTAQVLGTDAATRRATEQAGYVHDLGRVGVPSGTWERTCRLTSSDWERIRLHPYYTERILARIPALSATVVPAAMHHERMDGSGYHRGTHAREMPLGARILAAVDAFAAWTEPRPHRAALPSAAAAERMRNEARAGRFDVDVVRALLDVTGQSAAAVSRPLPAGLSDRGAEVLRLVARGSSNREIAEELVISRRTAEHHVQHIYDKIGVSTRAGAAMWALQHDILSPSLDS